MPIGVPRVAYQMTGDDDAQWVDLYNRMYRERVLFLGADLDDELSNQLVGIMAFLTIEDPRRDMFIYINSLGGAMVSGFAVYDIICAIPNRVLTLCIGTAASMASFILCAGEPGLRFALPHSRVMIHQPAGGTKGQAAEITRDSKQVTILRERVNYIYAEITCQTIEQIWIDMNRDKFLRPKGAQEYGLVDNVVLELELVERDYMDPSPFQNINPKKFIELNSSKPVRELQSVR